MSKEEMIEKIKMETRRYAKRQFTWFRQYDNMVWLCSDDKIEKNVEIIMENIFVTQQT